MVRTKTVLLSFAGAVLALLAVGAMTPTPSSQPSSQRSSQSSQPTKAVSENKLYTLTRDTPTCVTLDNLQMALTLAAESRPVPSSMGCWAAEKGQEVVVISIWGDYAYVGVVDKVNSGKSWMSLAYLQE